uniref:Sushi domain-containing protein n=1 Tax=Anabas testudineus TaxID=64144 RepID=A0A7N6BIB3_ANATE
CVCTCFLILLSFISAGLACFCERYPWGSWSACTTTCNHGTQQRHRNFQYDDYYWRSSCNELCERYDQRACNEKACPINCQLTDFGPWSECSPCAKKQFRTRSVMRPSQFGGSDCSVELTEERPCYPSTECKLPPIDCKDNFKCDNGRCINSTLTCNSQNDCGDNSDERGCVDPSTLCPEKRVAPGADLAGNGFDALAEEPRGAVLDNMFMGGSCNIKRPQSTIEPQTLHTGPINMKKASGPYGDSFFRVHQVLPVSTFKLRQPRDLVLSLPFVQFLHALPLDYNYCLYLLHMNIEAAALAWERQGSTPDKESFKNWAKSVLENPVVVNYKLLSIIDLVRGIPCAATKRRHLRKALLQYLEEFDTCKCAPCANNARPVLSGTECKCICQTGTFGTYCEKRAPDFTSEEMDGYWSCWTPWSRCTSSMKRHRTRQCNNPAPMRGGQPCQGPDRQEESCHISIFAKQNTCDNDDDFTVGWRNELPPGVQGCLRPQSPSNSFLRKAKEYYSFGEDEEFQCFTGFELEGFQFINCRPDGTWSQATGKCIRKICLPPDIPDGMTLLPDKDEYRVEESVSLSCNKIGQVPQPQSSFKCSSSLTWEPSIPADLHCIDEKPSVPGQCGPGRKLQNSQCVCIQRESCLSQPANLCVLNVDIGVTVSMSLCSFHAGRCHGDPLFFVSEGACNPADSAKLEWAKFRAKMSNKSSVQEPCELDTCYEWETCSVSKTCECRAARDCPKVEKHMFCVKLTRTQRVRSMDLCSMAALKCSSYQFEVINEGVCESR